MIDRAEIIARLNEIHDPCSVASGQPLGLSEMGLIETVDVDAEGRVAVDLRLTSPCCMMIGFFVTEIKAVLGALDGVSHVEVTHDIGERWEPEMIASSHRARRQKHFSQMERAASAARIDVQGTALS